LSTESKILEERSDYLEKDQIQNWFVTNKYFKRIQKKLIGTGAKLLIGPRGTGKTHHMLMTHHQCLGDASKPVSLYITFNKYFKLEPLISKATNAKSIFHTWVLSNILLSIYEFCQEQNIETELLINDNFLNRNNLVEFNSKAESGFFRFENHDIPSILSVSKVKAVIEKLITSTGRKRAIILFDDAALTLTPDYLIELFEIFTSLKSKSISPKASVYPGTTNYGPKFHPGHDAEEVECWINVSDNMQSYSDFMNEIINKRLSQLITDIDDNVIELLKFASFGIPRAFLFLLRSYTQSDKSTRQSKYNEVLDIHATLLQNEYLSLKKKMPQFSNIIETGFSFFSNLISEVVELNKSKKTGKTLTVGIEPSTNAMINRMIQFLNEAGLIYKHTSGVSHGAGRDYDRYTPHLLFLLKDRAFSTNRGFDTSSILNKLKSKESKQPLRRKFETILNPEDINGLVLNLPPCSNCNTVRIQEDQIFCHICGTKLIMFSAFEECMKIPITEVPLTPVQRRAIEESPFVLIGDIYSSKSPASELRKSDQIGHVRSSDILVKINNLVNEFLA